jgi:hypothetical protein
MAGIKLSFSSDFSPRDKSIASKALVVVNKGKFKQMLTEGLKKDGRKNDDRVYR